VASWDIARGRVPVTTSPLINDLHNTPEDRKCTRDVSAVVARHVTPGMTRAEALKLLNDAYVEMPQPWFWRPAREESVTGAPGKIGFVRVMRFTAFGNQKIVGSADIADDRVTGVSAMMVCPFS
jgi:hypothetical protein